MRAVKRLLMPLLLPLLAVVSSDAQSTKTPQAQPTKTPDGKPSKPRGAQPTKAPAQPSKPGEAPRKVRDPKSSRIRIFIGTYTGGDSESKGIYQMIFDPATGSLALDGTPTEAVSPSFLALNHDGRRLFAVNETGNSASDPPGGVSSFSVDPATGALTLVSRTSSAGAAPCHLSLDTTQEHVLLANYWGGSVMVLNLGADGRLGSASSYVRHTGDNPTPRDPGPHPHAVQVDPTNRWALVPDLGLDKVFVYPYDATRGTLGAAREFPMEKGAGPRHVAFDPEGRGVFVLNELNGTVISYTLDPADGTLLQLHSMSTLQPGFTGKNSSAEIALTPDGRYLYVSNRGPDEIAIFEVEGASRRLRRVGYQPTLGKHPRHFAIDPSGQFLVVANRDSNSIIVFKINQETGTLSPVAGPGRVPKPACVLLRRIS
jgi:6-phosphogluconolactonase